MIGLIGALIAILCLASWITASLGSHKIVTRHWRDDYIYRHGKGEFKR